MNVLDIKFPPVDLVPDGERRPMPSDEELDALFAGIGERARPTLSFVRAIFAGFSAHTLKNAAMIELLIAKGVLDEESRVHVQEIAHALDAQTNRQALRDFIGFAAKGLMKVNGKALSPDDVATLIAMFVGDNPDFGAALSTMVRRVFPPEHLAAFYAKAKLSDDPLKALLDYRVHEDPDEKLRAATAELRKAVAESRAAAEENAELRKDFSAAKVRIAALERGVAESEKSLSALRAPTIDKIDALEKEVGKLRDNLLAFRKRT